MNVSLLNEFQIVKNALKVNKAIKTHNKYPVVPLMCENPQINVTSTHKSALNRGTVK